MHMATNTAHAHNGITHMHARAQATIVEDKIDDVGIGPRLIDVGVGQDSLMWAWAKTH